MTTATIIDERVSEIRKSVREAQAALANARGRAGKLLHDLEATRRAFDHVEVLRLEPEWRQAADQRQLFLWGGDN